VDKKELPKLSRGIAQVGGAEDFTFNSVQVRTQAAFA
jgi:hypothetical protein